MAARCVVEETEDIYGLDSVLPSGFTRFERVAFRRFVLGPCQRCGNVEEVLQRGRGWFCVRCLLDREDSL